jgi:L-asparaginase
MPPSMKVKFFTAGGTIDKIYFDAKSDYEVGSPQVVEILREANATLDYEVERLFSKDSLDMTDEDRQLIRDRVAADPCRRIIITHGTDTMLVTAMKLLGLPDKTIVLTGSMQPARFRVTDAAFNIGTALGAVQSLPPGVYVAMNGRIFDPRISRKNAEKGSFVETE